MRKRSTMIAVATVLLTNVAFGQTFVNFETPHVSPLDMTPDGNAIMGPIPGLQRAYVAAGFSGHGFMHSPATGQVMAELILDGEARSVDIAPLSVERFARGEWLSEALVFSRPPEEG